MIDETCVVSEEVLSRHGVDKKTFVEQMRARIKDTIIGLLEIQFVELSSDRVVMKMPVGPKTWQPAGILHGGASVVLAETAASIATAINLDQESLRALAWRSTPIISAAKGTGLSRLLPRRYIREGRRWCGISR